MISAYSGLDLSVAGLAEFAPAQVDPFDCVRRGHHAVVFLAVAEFQRVPEFVDALLQQALLQNMVISLQPVKLLPQTEGGHDGAGPPNLSFAEHVFEDRDIKIDCGNADEAPVLRPDKLLHALQEFG